MEPRLAAQIPVEHFKAQFLECWEETFSSIRGIYLDKGTSLYETLEGVSAAEASRAISPKSASIAAQVEHVRFYLDVLDEFMRTGIDKKNNWREIWETVREVTPEQWEGIKRRLRQSHERVLATINSHETWDGEHDISA